MNFVYRAGSSKHVKMIPQLLHRTSKQAAVNQTNNGSKHVMKGQATVFEAVIIFTISVAIFVTLVAAFSMYQASWADISTNDQVDGIADFVTASLLQVAQQHGDMSATFLVPKRIGGQVYKLSFSGGALSIETLTASKNVSLYNLNSSFSLSGSVSSSRGKITLKREGSQISIV